MIARSTMANLNKPIVPAPANYVVDLENPQRRGEAIITCVGIMGIVNATALLIVRAYTKVVLVKKIASDDCRSRLQETVVKLSNTSGRVSLARVGRCSKKLWIILILLTDILLLP